MRRSLDAIARRYTASVASACARSENSDLSRVLRGCAERGARAASSRASSRSRAAAPSTSSGDEQRTRIEPVEHLDMTGGAGRDDGEPAAIASSTVEPEVLERRRREEHARPRPSALACRCGIPGSRLLGDPQLCRERHERVALGAGACDLQVPARRSRCPRPRRRATATSVCFSACSRCATSTVRRARRRVAGAPGSTPGVHDGRRDARSRSATVRLIAISASMRRSSDAVQEPGPSVPRGCAKCRVATSAGRDRVALERDDGRDIRGGHVGVDDVDVGALPRTDRASVDRSAARRCEARRSRQRAPAPCARLRRRRRRRCGRPLPADRESPHELLDAGEAVGADGVEDAQRLGHAAAARRTRPAALRSSRRRVRGTALPIARQA